MRWLIAGSMAMVVVCGSVAPVDADLIVWQQLPRLDGSMIYMAEGLNPANDWVADGRSVASVKWWGTSVNMSYVSFPSAHYQFDLSIWSDNPATAGPDVLLQSWEDALVFPTEYTPYRYVGEYCFELPASFPTVSGESYWFMVHRAPSVGIFTWAWIAAPSTLEERSGYMRHDGVWQPFQDYPNIPARDLSLEINAVVPEPSTFVLVALGVLALAPLMRRR